MYSFFVLPLLFLVCVNCNPTPNASECTKEKLDEKNRCKYTVETSSEYLLIKARLQTLIPQCIPNYQNTCQRRNDLADTCSEQLEFNAVQNQSLSSDERRKSFQAINNCLPSFYDEFWSIMEDKLRQRPLSGQQQQQQQGQNGQQQQSGINNQEQPRSNRQQRGAQQQPGQNGQQQPGQQQPGQQQPGQQQPGQSGQQQPGSNGQQQPRGNRQQRGVDSQQKTTHSTPSTPTTHSPTPRPTPRFARQANFEQKYNGNDQCIPNAQQFSCLVDALIQTNQMAEMGQRLLQQQKQCQNNSANCQFQANFNKQDCSNQDLKPIADQLKGQFQDCIANQGTKS